MTTWLKNHRGQIILNLITILIIGSMLTIYSVKAAPQRQTSPEGFNPGVFSYQGYLSDKNGQPLTGEFPMVFRLYDQPTGGTMLWEEYREGPNQVPVIDGQVNLMLGNITPIPESVWVYPQLYLGIFIGQDGELTPRTLISAVPFAYRAQRAAVASSIDDGIVTKNKLSPSIHIPSIQKGYTRCSNAACPGWGLSSGVGARTYSKAVVFPVPFSSPPQVIASLSGIDTLGSVNTRVEVMVSDINANGFNLVFKTYSDSVVYGVLASWVAFE